jgi:transposase
VSFTIIEKQQSQLEDLKQVVSELKERVRLDTKNSSKPPSSDFKKKKKPKERVKRSSGRSKGGQPGRKGTTGRSFSPDTVTAVVSCKLGQEVCECGGRIHRKETTRHQVIDIPAVNPVEVSRV